MSPPPASAAEALVGQETAPDVAPDAAFRISYLAGQRDEAGRFLGGTEITHLRAYGGRLYAATSMWMDTPGDDPRPGPQVLVLDRPGGRWRLDKEFPASTLRVTALDGATFATDADGRLLEKPVSMLLAAPTGRGPEATVYSRDDVSGTWTPTALSAMVGPVKVRALRVHRDRVTGVDRVMAGCLPSGVVSGVYDPAASGRIRWDNHAELPGVEKRVMAFAECSGVLHALVSTAMYRRIDGPQPRWEHVYSSSVPATNPRNSGLRGLTAVPNPSGEGEVLLAALEGPSARVLRLDPAAGYREQVELDAIEFLRGRWEVPVRYAIVAYNDMVPVVDPATHRTVHLLGIEAGLRGRANHHGWEVGGWYLLRHADGRYELRQVADPALQPKSPLIATRAIVASPFETDRGQVIYFGGYDANYQPAHNTAWIIQGALRAVLGGPHR